MKPDYKNSCVYKLCCKDPTIKECYVGSTTNFRGRKNCHKNKCNSINDKSYNRYVYRFIRDNGGWLNWTMIELEKVDCDDCKILHKREREWLEKLGASLNKNIPNRTKKEYQKNHYENNKDKIKKKVTCECGCIVCKGSLSKHRKTAKHKNKMKFN